MLYHALVRKSECFPNCKEYSAIAKDFRYLIHPNKWDFIEVEQTKDQVIVYPSREYIAQSPGNFIFFNICLPYLKLGKHILEIVKYEEGQMLLNTDWINRWREHFKCDPYNMNPFVRTLYTEGTPAEPFALR